jgi:phage-related protein
MADFPTLSKQLDASAFKMSYENPSTKEGETDGGYVITRARHTRRPRRIFTIRFVDITETDRLALEAFWDARRGGSEAFNWTNPVTSDVFNVRFDSQNSIEFNRVGYGTNHRYDTNEIVLKEV